MAGPRKKLSREERLEKKRQAERLRYQRIKNNPEKYAEQKGKERRKYLTKKEQGIIKSINDMTPREQRKMRKIWREQTKKYRKCLALQNVSNAPITLPNSENEAALQPQNVDGRAIAARRRSINQRKLRCKNMKKQKLEIEKLKSEVARYKKILQKIQKPKTLTPNTKVNAMLDSAATSRETIKRKLLLGEVLSTQLKENFPTLKSDKEKTLFRRMISGRLVNKYSIFQNEKNMKPFKGIIRKRPLVDPDRKMRKYKLGEKTIKKVIDFFEEDSHSRLCARKKECITRNKERKQKRVLLDTMKNLHRKFLNREDIIISYTLFCRFKPFWIVQQHVDERETCLCVIHANIDLTLCSLSQANIVCISSHQKLLEHICCNRYDEKCLSRKCKDCRTKFLQYMEFDNSVAIKHKKWLSITEEIIDLKTKKVRKVRKYVKKTLTSPPCDIIIEFESDLQKFLNHEINIVHQYQTIKKLKENLTEKDCIIHMDFSENYQTKYSEEIQSFHFGGSRLQISLHTVVVYTKDIENGGIQTNCFCTMSTNLAHSPPAIWAHLNPVLRSLPPSVENLHFLSNGPVTQYRNKTMFYLLACHLPDFYLNVRHFSWNYHEAGHGKGAPDGVGAVCKRTADNIVATGSDVVSLEDLSNAVEKNFPDIRVFVISDSDISEKEILVNENQKRIKTFTGTLRVHQVVGNILLPNRLHMKTLSCFCDQCCHYKIGNLIYDSAKVRLNVNDVYESDSGSEDEPQPGTSNNEAKYKSGDFVLVKFLLKKKEYRYVALCTGIEEEDEIQVTFSKICDDAGRLFKLDENDTAFVAKEQIVQILPTPSITPKGARIFYSFKAPVNVFEQA